MNKIKIMTYNLCWEALEGAIGNIDMTRCIVKKENKCLANIGIIINNKLEKNYDFICLQEINEKQWKELSKNLSLDNYNVIKYEIFPAGVITLYNKKYKLKKEIGGNLIDVKLDKRPFLISIFDNISVINLHMPHIKQDIAFKLLKTNIKKLDNNYIICGDFNNTNPYKYLSKLVNIKKEPILIKSCCDANNEIYKLSYDHIFISSKAKYLKYGTLKKTEKTKYMSDHLPIFAKIII